MELGRQMIFFCCCWSKENYNNITACLVGSLSVTAKPLEVWIADWNEAFPSMKHKLVWVWFGNRISGTFPHRLWGHTSPQCWTHFTTVLSWCKPLLSQRKQTLSIKSHHNSLGAAMHCEGSRTSSGKTEQCLPLQSKRFLSTTTGKREWDRRSCQKWFICYLCTRCGHCQEQSYNSPSSS